MRNGCLDWVFEIYYWVLKNGYAPGKVRVHWRGVDNGIMHYRAHVNKSVSGISLQKFINNGAKCQIKDLPPNVRNYVITAGIKL